jgi:hypothetical protein
VIQPDTSEVEPNPSPAPAEPGPTANRLPTVLLALATLLAVVSVFSTWARVQALDTDQFVSLSDQLLAEPQVQEALAIYLVDQLYEQLDVSGELKSALPENLEGLAGTLSAALRAPATNGVGRLVGSQQFRTTWLAVNRAAHQTLVNVLKDETRSGISTADGSVTLELGELVLVVGRQLGLSDSLLDRLPQDAGRVTVFESDQLDLAQTAVRVLEFLSWFLLLVVAGLYAAAVYFATDRIRMLRNVGLCLISASVVVLAMRAITQRAVVDAIVANPGNRPVANVTAYVVTGLIRQIAWSGITYGLIITAFAGLLGTRRWAATARRFLAPMLNASTGAVVAGTVGLVLLVQWWSPGRAFDRWVTALLLVAAIAAGVGALRRSTQREYPNLTFADITASIGERFGRSDSAGSGDGS